MRSAFLLLFSECSHADHLQVEPRRQHGEIASRPDIGLSLAKPSGESKRRARSAQPATAEVLLPFLAWLCLELAEGPAARGSNGRWPISRPREGRDDRGPCGSWGPGEAVGGRTPATRASPADGKDCRLMERSGQVIRARVVGAGGFGGANIVELLIGHPQAEVVSLVDVQGVGEPLSKRHTHLKGFCDAVVSAPDAVRWDGSLDVTFCATPDGVGMTLARDCVAAGVRLIDYSGDFRFNTMEVYAQYAERIGRDPRHAAPELLEKCVYGLSELHRGAIARAPIVGNPGCFAVAAILGLAPAVKERLVDLPTLVCDAKTGVSGAGIKPQPAFHYPLRYENMNAYKIGAHQHVVEIERELSLLAGREVRVTLTTQVVPLTRGIMATLYGSLAQPATTAEELYEAYAAFYRGAAFVRVERPGVPVSNNDVRGSNLCVISVNVDTRTSRMIIVAHIDNLMKGQAGSALQNMNIMFGLPEDTGLRRPAYYP